MTFKLMLSVERELIQRIADHCKFWIDHPYLEAIADVEVELRALLDKQYCGACDGCANGCKLDRESPQVEPAAPHQSEPVAVVPEGYCLMPRSLTAENGAKALLIGEFKLKVTMVCPECCELEEPTEGCGICDGEGEYVQQHTIPWDQIKFIYSEAVRGLARNNEAK